MQLPWIDKTFRAIRLSELLPEGFAITDERYAILPRLHRPQIRWSILPVEFKIDITHPVGYGRLQAGVFAPFTLRFSFLYGNRACDKALRLIGLEAEHGVLHLL